MNNIDLNLLIAILAAYMLVTVLVYHLLNWLENGTVFERSKFNKAANFGIALFWWALGLVCISSFACYGIARGLYWLTHRKERV